VFVVSRQARARRGITYVLIVVLMIAASQIFFDRAFGTSPVYVVVSSSMVPTLRIGDIVIAQHLPFDSIQVGDIVIFNVPTPNGGCRDLTIVHRVVGIVENGGLITQGDNRATNPRPDEPYQWPYLHENCVRGKVLIAIPYAGLISMFFPPPLNYFLVGTVLILVFLSELRGKDKASKENQAS
jgi:signal peptidase